MSVTNAALIAAGAASAKRAVVVIGTVQGDVHDIGKAIVIAYLTANSYEVHDLGRDCPIETFLAKAEEHQADIIAQVPQLFTPIVHETCSFCREEASGCAEAACIYAQWGLVELRRLSLPA